ncbi:hypothetical protein B0H34DRAFT_86673 [Crassisporium funariophilum]|nr:hypothetical protein B0H34DRAFT_86673 [Crassisporium funariophilum]
MQIHPKSSRNVANPQPPTVLEHIRRVTRQPRRTRPYPSVSPSRGPDSAEGSVGIYPIRGKGSSKGRVLPLPQILNWQVLPRPHMELEGRGNTRSTAHRVTDQNLPPSSRRPQSCHIRECTLLQDGSQETRPEMCRSLIARSEPQRESMERSLIHGWKTQETPSLLVPDRDDCSFQQKSCLYDPGTCALPSTRRCFEIRQPRSDMTGTEDEDMQLVLSSLQSSGMEINLSMWTEEDEEDLKETLENYQQESGSFVSPDYTKENLS